MPNIEITDNKPRSIVVFDAVFDDAPMTSSGANTFLAGTVLGRLTANGNMVPWASGGSAGAEIPVAVLAVEEVFAGASTRNVRPVMGGRVRAVDLIEHGVGAVAADDAALLRDWGIIALSSTTLTELDNR